MDQDFNSLELALRTLKTAISAYQSHVEDEELHLVVRDGVIQRFEYVYELCWKFIQRWASLNISEEAAIPTWSRRELFRLAAERGLLDDPAPWFTFTEARILSAHAYDPANAEKALQAALALVGPAEQLLERLRRA